MYILIQVLDSPLPLLNRNANSPEAFLYAAFEHGGSVIREYASILLLALSELYFYPSSYCKKKCV